MNQDVSTLECSTTEPACTDPLEPRVYREIVATMALTGHKWDIQMGDTAVLAPYAMTISEGTWRTLVVQAEALAGELLDAEAEVAERPELWRYLGVPARLRDVLGRREPWTPSATRVMRFDFHPTAAGWRISEVNSDVPGGFNEASTFTALMEVQFRGLRAAGDPLAVLAKSLAKSVGPGQCAALLSAPGYLEDHQVVSGVSAKLREFGVQSVRTHPDHVLWRDGCAWVDMGGEAVEAGVVYRFFQAEWVTRLREGEWGGLFRGGRTPVCNPGMSALSESKRLPLIWPRLATPMPTWRTLLPRTRSPWRAAFDSSSPCIRKTAYCNTGDVVVSRAWSGSGRWLASMADSLLRPGSWIVQDQFQSAPIDGPEGPVHVCLGVYVIDGRAAGIYGRASRRPAIDFMAQDLAVLIRD